jgi:L-alanine-DL-glutamate epimerase-like enolase superfamily enzyme
MPDRPAVFIRLEDTEGVFGWGELWSNFPSVGAEYRARLFAAVIAPRLMGYQPGSDPASFWRETDHSLHIPGLQTGEPGAFAAALAGADIALHDLAARRAGVALWQFLDGQDSSPVPVYASGINPGEAAPGMIEAARGAGFRGFKVKLGFGEKEDLATLGAVSSQLMPGERLMVDINQKWNGRTASRMAAAFAGFPLSWIEEPIAADRPAREWRLVAEASRAPLAAGENLRGFHAFERALRTGAISVMQPDLCKWGGLTAGMLVARMVLAANRVFCPHFLGAGVGLMASLHLLAAVRGPGMAEMDVNPNPLREDLLRGVLAVENGAVALPSSPGLGFEPDLSPFLDLRTLHIEVH